MSCRIRITEWLDGARRGEDFLPKKAGGREGLGAWGLGLWEWESMWLALCSCMRGAGVRWFRIVGKSRKLY